METQVSPKRKGKFMFLRADGTIKQEGHVVPRPHRFFNTEIALRGEIPTLQDNPQPCRRRQTISGAFQAIPFIVTTWHFAVSCTCSLNRFDAIRQTNTNLDNLEESIIDD